MRWQWQLTTVWTNGHVFLFLSEKPDECTRASGCRMINASMCTAQHYQSLAEDLLRGSSLHNTRRVWSVFQQSFPFGTFEEIPGKGFARIPDWLEECWRNLPYELLPHAVHGGIEALKHHFENSGYLPSPGSGMYSAYNGRGYFLGHDEKETFVRISRDALWMQSDCIGLSEDWLQQTAMLYRNRTGCELSKIYLMHERSAELTQPPSSRVVIESISFAQPGASPYQDLPTAIKCIASVTVESGNLDDLRFRILQERNSRMAMDTAYKWGTSLLVIGWISLFLGACKEVTQNESSVELMREWEDARKTWHSENENFHRWSDDMRKKRIELSLIGLIGRSVPPSFTLKRVGIRHDHENDKLLLISLAGELHPDEPPASFKTWLDHLLSVGVIDRVNDLKFDQSGSALKVLLEGECLNGNTTS